MTAAITVDDLVSEIDDSELPGVGIVDSGIVSWYLRKFGRQPSYKELDDIRSKRSAIKRRPILKMRRQGFSDEQIVDKFVTDFLSSPEALAGAAIVGAALVALRESIAFGLQLSDWAGSYEIRAPLASSPRPTVIAAYEYVASKLDGAPVPASARLLSHDMLAAINATDIDGLRDWRQRLEQRKNSTPRVQNVALARLAAEGRQAREAHADLQAQLAMAEPGPPRALRPSRTTADEQQNAAPAVEESVDEEGWHFG